jgi:hypothetical protein
MVPHSRNVQGEVLLWWSWLEFFMYAPARCTTTGSTFDKGLLWFTTRVWNYELDNASQCDDLAIPSTLHFDIRLFSEHVNLIFYQINLVCGDNTSPLLEDIKPSVSIAQSVATRAAFHSSSKLLNLNTTIRFAPHNVIPVTIESCEKLCSNSTGSSPTFWVTF